MTILAQSYLVSDFLIVLLVVLGLIAMCVPRRRKKFAIVDKRKKLVRKRPKKK